MKKIKVAIAGVGNCASALVQGVEYYRTRRNAALDGIMRATIGGYACSDIEFVAEQAKPPKVARMIPSSAALRRVR